MNILEKLLNIQQNLKSPKNQYNSFGGYNYRNCEDILEAVKPLLKENKCVLTLSDEIINIGTHNYVKSTAILRDIEKIGDEISNNAWAREAEIQKGMNDSQITGSTSSYARKYALNGLFDIDDTKDADTDEFTKETQKDTKEDKKPQETQNNTNKEVSKPKTMDDIMKAMTVELYNTLQGGQKLKVRQWIAEKTQSGSPFVEEDEAIKYLSK